RRPAGRRPYLAQSRVTTRDQQSRYVARRGNRPPSATLSRSGDGPKRPVRAPRPLCATGRRGTQLAALPVHLPCVARLAGAGPPVGPTTGALGPSAQARQDRFAV